MSYCVYKYTNIYNGKVYVGQTKRTLEERALGGRGYNGSRVFYNAICEYGWQSFEGEILEDGLTRNEAGEREQYYIRLYQSNDSQFGYNVNSGGASSYMSDESKKVISDKAKERYKDKTKNPMCGKKHSDETRAKMREAAKHKPPVVGHKWTDRQRELFKQRVALGLHKPTKEQSAAAAKRLKNEKIASKRIRCIDDGREWPSAKSAALDLMVDQSSVAGAANGKQKTCKGLRFEYVT